jgi:AmmeMemoRadiSam system protein A
MFPLPDDERRALLKLARRSIVFILEHHRELEVAEESLVAEILESGAGVFVTVRLGGRLCGCIGQIESLESLPQVVAHCAAGAVTQDPRFDPVPLNDLGQLAIEISVLSAVKAISLEQIVLGRHGLVVTRGRRRGLLLPQVPIDLRWDTQQFLEEACVKAGLDRKAWLDPETRIEGFTTESFSEADFVSENEHRRAHGQSSYSSST